MKKALLIFVIIFSVTAANAQYKQLNVRGGATISSLYETYTSNKSLVIGAEAGLGYRKVSKHNWGFETGIYYAGKGTKFNNTGVKVHLDYVGANADLLYNFPLVHNNDLLFGAGVFVADAIGGKSTKDSTGASEKLVFGDDWTRFDGGIEVRAGFVINKTVTIGAHYGIGIFNIHSDLDPRGRSNKGRSSSATVNVEFNLYKLMGKK
jgi:hypothetical protein